MFYSIPPISPPYIYGDDYYNFLNRNDPPEGLFRVVRIRGTRRLLGGGYVVICPENHFPSGWTDRLIKMRDVVNLSRETRKIYVADRKSLSSIGGFERLFG